MDLKNNNESFVTSPLQMRIAIRSGSNVNVGYSSTTAYILPRDDQWHHAVFSLKADSLTAVALENLSPPPLTDVLANVLEFHILNSSAPKTTGDTPVRRTRNRQYQSGARASGHRHGDDWAAYGPRPWLTHKRSSVKQMAMLYLNLRNMPFRFTICDLLWRRQLFEQLPPNCRLACQVSTTSGIQTRVECLSLRSIRVAR